MNAITVETGLFASLIFISITGILYVGSESLGRKFSKYFLFRNQLEKVKEQPSKAFEHGRSDTLWRKRVTLGLSLFILLLLAGLKLFLSELFFYILPCVLFLIFVLNMDRISQWKKDTAGEAAMGYLIFISYLVFIILFLFLITIYFQDSETLFLFLTR